MSDNTRVGQSLFKPRSIAIVGASSDPLKPGGRVLLNIKDNNFTGDLWPVNPKATEIMGLPSFSDVSSLPSTPELALIAIPAPLVLGAMKDLANKGTRTVIILTAGFGEKGEEGKAEERRILELAKTFSMTVIGPNCSGFLTPVYAGKFAGIIPKMKHGQIDFVSGSGATVDYVMEQAVTRGLQFSHVLNLGNSIQMGVEDMLELLDESHSPESARLILLYLEAVNKPQKLLKHVNNLREKGCTFVGIKSGTTDAGAKAAASHTGAMASSDHAVQALFDKAGIIRVFSKQELIEVACVLSSMTRLPAGNRACIVTDAGGPGVMLSDELNRQNIELPTFSEKTLKRLAEVLPPQASLVNPIDCLPSRNAKQTREIFTILDEEESENLDVAFYIIGNSGMSDNWEIYKEIIEIRKRCSIPILPVFSSATTCADLLKKVINEDTIYFPDEVPAGRAVGRIVNRPVPAGEPEVLGNYDKEKISSILSKAKGTVLPQEAVESVLKAAGFNLPAQSEVCRETHLEEVCNTIGYPLVMKVVGPLHKSEIGGVTVGISNDVEAQHAWKKLMTIPDATGVLVQKMVQGLEVILGASREERFGHLILFGLGGIYTEVLKDVQFSLAPLSHNEASKMIRGIRSFKILEGVRGKPGASLETLADNLMRLSQLVTDFPIIQELDLNPIKGVETDLYAVDGRILLGNY
ncbi:acetate--CoA ligase family protein [bacterium]|nr:acetate--CoA ligase family protein [bacterium]